MNRLRDITGVFAPRIADFAGAEWDACFRDEAENHAYYSACERAGADRTASGAVFATRGSECLAVAPVFALNFSLGTAFQADAGPVAQARRALTRSIGWPVIGLGSPFAERCHVGWRQGLSAADRDLSFEALIDALEGRARERGTRLLALKDVSAPLDAPLERVLTRRGYVRLSGLPVASLDLHGVATLDDYFARLSASTRKDLRRKLRTAERVRIEDCHDIAPYAREITALYESTRTASRFDYGAFEVLPPEYFTRVSAALRERALFKLYWVGNTLAAFNLLLIEPHRLIDKFLGMRYPLARDHNLYALSWVENVRHCLAHGIRALQTGQTAYREKLRLGSRLVPTSIWFRHRGRVLHQVLRAFAPLASFERNDPQLAGASLEHTA